MGGGDPEQLGRSVVKSMNKSEQELLDVEEDLYYLVIKYIDKMKEVSGLLDSVSDPLIYDIMHKRYIQGKKVKEIAEEEMEAGGRVSVSVHG